MWRPPWVQDRHAHTQAKNAGEECRCSEHDEILSCIFEARTQLSSCEFGVVRVLQLDQQ
jgi:hypothetical protein